MLMNDMRRDAALTAKFEDFVRDQRFPCVGAKSALNKGQMNILVATDIGSAWDDLRILSQVTALARQYREKPDLFQTLVVIFKTSAALGEEGFETALWERLQSLSDKDEWLGCPPDPAVSTDPDDPHFAVSISGSAFYVVGLHPDASRPARRFAYPAMVFNLHDQFEQLRAMDRYTPLRDAIIERDIQLAGSANPMLANHGSISAARQYSGRQVDDSWQCPFTRRGRSDHAAP
jgi:uncharacterized protein